MFTPKQIAALKYLIFNSQDGTKLSKQVLASLIDSSEGLTKDVCLSLVTDREGYNSEEVLEAANGIHDMQSSNGTTHLHGIISAMGSELDFAFYYGDFDSTRTGDPFNNDNDDAQPVRYTFWLSRKDNLRQAELVIVNREKLESINLKKPGLYPSLEPV